MNGELITDLLGQRVTVLEAEVGKTSDKLGIIRAISRKNDGENLIFWVEILRPDQRAGNPLYRVELWQLRLFPPVSHTPTI